MRLCCCQNCTTYRARFCIFQFLFKKQLEFVRNFHLSRSASLLGTRSVAVRYLVLALYRHQPPCRSLTCAIPPNLANTPLLHLLQLCFGVTCVILVTPCYFCRRSTSMIRHFFDAAAADAAGSPLACSRTVHIKQCSPLRCLLALPGSIVRMSYSLVLHHSCVTCSTNCSL